MEREYQFRCKTAKLHQNGRCGTHSTLVQQLIEKLEKDFVESTTNVSISSSPSVCRYQRPILTAVLMQS
jgi:hypothetical protein